MVLQIIDGFENYLIFEPQQFQSFDYFMNEFVDDGNLIIFEIVKFGQFFFFQYGKPKFDPKNWRILVSFVPLIFRTIHNFANSHICSFKF